MNKLLSILAVFACFATAASAQRTGSVSGQVTSNETSEKVAGATIEVRSVADTTFVRGTASGPDSKYTIAELPYGDYTVNVSALGYKPQQVKVTVNARNIQMGHVFLQKNVIQMDEINIAGQAVRVSAQGDTIVYNAAAFKTSEFADADELLRQLPGVVVGEDGTVKAQGKDVQKIFVDGKETFGTDVSTTMKNIPANVIEKVEVYNKLSDFAETTGINDGDDYQVMNFVTGVTFAQMGTYSALYGLKNKYAFELRHHIVTGNHGFIINGTANNTGNLGFGGGFGGGGIIAGMIGGGGYGSRFGGGGGMSIDSKATAQTAGMNYNYQNGEKIRVSFHYGFGHRDNESKNLSDRTYFNKQRDLYNRSIESSKSASINNAHNFGGNVNWKMTAKQNLSFRFNGSYSESGSTSLTDTRQFTDTEENLFQSIERDNENNSESYNLSGELNYGLKFNKQNRSLSFALNGSIRKSDGNSLQNAHQIIVPEPALDSLGRSKSLSDSNGWNVRGRAQYSEPLSLYWSLMTVYNFSYSFSDSDRSAQRWEYYDNFNDGHFVDWGENSNVSQTRDVSHRIGPGIYFSKNNDIFRFDFVYKYTEQHLERTLPEPYLKDKVSFNNFVYSAMLRKRFTPQSNMEIRLEADTRNPSVSQLQDVDDISNNIYVTTGNPDLKPYYTHSASIGYNMYGITRGTSFTIGANGSMTTDYIGTWRKLVTEEEFVTPNGNVIKRGGQYSMPINMNKSAWSFGANANYGKLLKFIKTNFNVSAGVNYNETPGYINDEENIARTQSYSLATTLSSNWSTDFTMYLMYRFSPGVTNNTHIDYGRSTNLNQSLSMNITWRTWWNFVFRTNATYTNRLDKIDSRDKQQNGTNDGRFENLACNMSLGKLLFKNKRGEITFTVNDLFDQNKDFNQTIQPDYIENTVARGVGRYFSVSFTYRLRDFHKNGQSMGGRSQRPDRGDFRFDGERGGRRSGGGRGGFMR